MEMLIGVIFLFKKMLDGDLDEKKSPEEMRREMIKTNIMMAGIVVGVVTFVVSRHYLLSILEAVSKQCYQNKVT